MSMSLEAHLSQCNNPERVMELLEREKQYWINEGTEAERLRNKKELLEIKKQIDQTINAKAKEYGIDEGWKELTFLLTRKDLQSKAWTEFLKRMEK